LREQAKNDQLDQLIYEDLSDFDIRDKGLFLIAILKFYLQFCYFGHLRGKEEFFEKWIYRNLRPGQT